MYSIMYALLILACIYSLKVNFSSRHIHPDRPRHVSLEWYQVIIIVTNKTNVCLVYDLSNGTTLHF